MQLKIFPDYQALSGTAASEVIELIKRNPRAVLCFASGDTPKLTCQLIVQNAIRENVDVQKLTFIGLDEWLGIPPDNPGSCHYFFQHLLINPLQFSHDQVHLFNALAEDPQAECRAMDKIIVDKGGIDLMIVGIGMNGHIGFNEPGVSFDKYSHVAELDDTTTTVGQKYFSAPEKLKKGITLGFKHVMQSKKLFLLANGKKKAGVVRDAVEGEVTTSMPASIIQKHSNAVVILDDDAASELKNKNGVRHKAESTNRQQNRT